VPSGCYRSTCTEKGDGKEEKMTTFSDMAFDLGGRPLGGAKYANPFAKHWFVDGGVTNSGDGKAPDRAYKTIQEAVTAAGVGDVVYVRPKTYVVGTGHARYEECVTVDLAESDLSIIGAGYSRSNEFGVRMKADGTTLYCIDSSAPSLHLENMGFFGSSSTNTIIIRNNGATNTQRSDGFTAYNCNFKGDTTLVQGGQAPRFTDCVFNEATNQLCIGAPAASSYNAIVRGCYFLDNGTTAPTHPQYQDGGGGTYCLWIDNCYFGKIPTTTAYYITIAGANSSGMATNCYFNTTNLCTDDDISIASSNFMLVGCYDKTGLVDDTAD